MTRQDTVGGRTADTLSREELAMIDRAWEVHKAAMPVATIINDNQPYRTAIIEITIEPPTLPVGTRLYAEPKAIPLAGESVTAEELAEEMRLECWRRGGPPIYHADKIADAILGKYQVIAKTGRAALKTAGGE
ncbi:hypothetical protein BN961_02174 [Afipia felis]|uniref:Uncharacterized protein n=1 Tax=Afipia felis TaxID=1035 RepID=A0A090MN01_AFIFE|nr:hypothetical protein [Afipia felis]CEG08756.1 hypothetical protein BN961_02174 [Afipia felis]